MKYAKTFSFQTNGINASLVTIEADITNGLHSFSIVGLGDKAVNESRDRVSSAIKNCGLVSPKQKNQKVVISLAPANTHKEGPAFDLGIAIAYLSASGDIKADISDKAFIGELSLDGRISGVRGIISALVEMRRIGAGLKEIFIPKENMLEARHVKGLAVRGVAHLRDVVEHLHGMKGLKESDEVGVWKEDDEISISPILTPPSPHDFKYINGQHLARRALEIAAMGRHNVLLYGPPGAGKTMLTRAFHTILPGLDEEEFLEMISIQSSFSGGFSDGYRRPFRSPHHTSSYASIIGGGSPIRPGEITLAHHGILFLDEFPEFDRRAIESLRQPLEDRIVSLSRIKEKISYPANFILVGAMNLCPCGYGDDRCRCTEREQNKYKEKISSAILDRIDMFISVHENDEKALRTTECKENESSQQILDRIEKALLYKKSLIDKNPDLKNPNSKNQNISDEAVKLMGKISAKFRLSTRSRMKTISVSQTIAFLSESDKVSESHILEAMQYRQRPWD